MLKDQIITDLTSAMKTRDELTLRTLRMLKADIMKYEVSGADMTATDEVIIDLIKKGIKQRKDAIEGFKRGGNEESARAEADEITVLEKYMPEQMSEEEVSAIVRETIEQIGANGPSDFGKVMGAVMGKVKGKADGGVVNKLVKELL